MKHFKFIFLALVGLLLSSCNQVSLPQDLMENEAGYNTLIEYVNSHYPDLNKDNMELMEFSYSGSIHPQKGDLSTSMSVDFVKGSNKDRIVNYSVDNDKFLQNRGVDITIGEIGKEKLSNSYETYKPYLFSSKVIDLEKLRSIIAKATEEFKKETNVDKAYCSSLSIEIEEPNASPIVDVTIEQKEFATRIKRFSTWTLDGEKIK